MDGRKIILLVGALVVAAVTAFMARSLMVGGSAPQAEAQLVQPAQPAGPQILVAAKALPVGTILDGNALKFQPWPKDLVEGAYYLKGQVDLPALQGSVVRFAIPAGQPITQGAVVKPGDRGFLAAALSPGMRAVTVPVSAQSAVAGFVFPGDRVDLILTQSVTGGGDGPPLQASETVLRNLRVLATDQRTDTQKDENGKPMVAPYSTVTVEATPKIAEKIAVAQQLGTLSLSLRSLADTSHELEEKIAAGDVVVGDNDELVANDSKPVDSRPTYSTGADVSRFQRSTVPGKADTNAAPQQSATMPAANANGAPPQNYKGPLVRVARGNEVTVVPVGGNK
ncbi:Flp pilus assembly protein CpaB [Stakelama sp. CBK3Z-3]|uniref:Flp pilus assembly protein CpaB n=1 Tax=Stakelama flava TaxID=2860338 RepID=A0ABS6XMS8_9SPHN|nr:Flp pilus assembly protein CpaB [Stakelama flava]MBW4331496.1 Flp pilus assembly protein CpaB [Stakelama flava]